MSRFESFLVEADANNDNKADSRTDKMKFQITKKQKELADYQERMGYVNAKKESADEKEITQIDVQLARMAQRAERMKEEIARLKGKL